MDTEVSKAHDEYSLRFFFAIVLAIIIVTASIFVKRLIIHRNGRKVPLSRLSTPETIRMMTSKSSPILLHEQSLILGTVFRLPMPQWRPFIMCMDTQVSKEIFQDAASDKPDLYKVIEIPRGCPVLVSKKTKGIGETSWAAERKAFAACFAKNQYNFNCAKEHLAKLDMILEATICHDDGNFEAVSRVMCQYTVDAFAESAYGIEMNAFGGPPSSLGNTFLTELHFAHEELVLRQISAPWRRYMFWSADVKRGNLAAKRCLDIGHKILAEAKRLKDSDKLEAKPGKLMETMFSFPFSSEDQRAAETISFLTGGFDTTGYSLAWTLYELAQHPDEQTALAADLLAESQPPRLNRVVNEAMRLWPVVGGGGIRVASRDFACSDGVVIPKGSDVSFPLYGSYRQPWIHDANEFKPSRWCDDAPQVADLREAFAPFNRGRRACIGQTHALLTIKLTVAHLIRNYEWSVLERPKVAFYLTLKPEGLQLKVKKRA